MKKNQYVSMVLFFAIVLTPTLSLAHDSTVSALSGGEMKTAQADVSNIDSLSSGLSGTNARSVAEQRKTLLLDLAKKSPALFLATAMSAENRAKLPVEAQSSVEKKATLSGTLQVLHVDDFSKPEKSHFEYFLASGGKRYELYVPTTLSTPANSEVSVSGFSLGNAIVAHTRNVKVTRVSKKPESVGVQKTAIVLVDFLNSGPRPFEPKYIKDYIFKGQFEKFYEEQSYNKVKFTGDVFGWYTLPRDYADACSAVSFDDISNIIKKGEINLSKYDRLVLIPYGPDVMGGCSFVGKSDHTFNNVNYRVSISWVGGGRFNEPSGWGAQPFSWSNLDYVMVHELGHALGVYHANGWDCGDKALYNNCSHIEYGNYFDAMGSGGFSLHFNALYKELLGWLPPTRIKSLAPGVITNIFPLENAKDVVLLKVPETANSTNTPYYLEYRQGVGFDKNLNNSELLSNQGGVFINKKISDSWGNVFPRLVDVQPTSDYWWEDSKQASLNNATFTDPGRGLTIQSFPPTAKGGLPVKVTYKTPQCVHSNPDVYNLYSPAQWSPVGGGEYTYIMSSFSNNDYFACGRTTYDLRTEAQSPLFVDDNNNYVTDSYPEESNFYYNSIYVPEGTPAGEYKVTVSVTDNNSGLNTAESILIKVSGPVVVENKYLPTGTLDQANCSAVAGWARDLDSDPTPGTTNSRLIIKLYDGPAENGVLLDEFQTNNKREPEVGFHGFVWPWPESLKDGQSRDIYAYAVDAQDGTQSKQLNGSPKSVACNQLLPIGTLDQVNCSAVAGWARDPNSDPTSDTANAVITIKLYDGPAESGTLLAQLPADKVREKAVGIHGFVWTWPESLKDGQYHDIYAYAVDAQDGAQSKQLNGSPKPITCASAKATSASQGASAVGSFLGKLKFWKW